MKIVLKIKDGIKVYNQKYCMGFILYQHLILGSIFCKISQNDKKVNDFVR
jgi:hypothetical protein